jgi:ketosteroid isomerase-like protein
LKIYNAQQKRDLRSIIMLMSPNVEIVPSDELPWGGHYIGHDGVKKFLTTLIEHVDSQVQVERMIDAGDKIAVVGRTVGKARKTQLEFGIPIVHIWTVREGQVIRFEPYIDNATMLAALGDWYCRRRGNETQIF